MKKTLTVLMISLATFVAGFFLSTAITGTAYADVIINPDQVIWNSQSANPLGSFPQSPASMNIDGSAFINSYFYAGPQYSGGNPINATLFVSGPSGRVGINTITPDTGSRLDVNGKVKVTEFCLNGDCRTSWPVCD